MKFYNWNDKLDLTAIDIRLVFFLLCGPLNDLFINWFSIFNILLSVLRSLVSTYFLKQS